MMVEAHYHYHQRWYKKIDTVELVSIITTHEVSNKKAKTSSPPYNELRGRELILKLINNIRGCYLFSQGRGSGSGAPEKNFAFPPRFLGGKGFSDCFLGKIDTSRTQFLRHIKSIIQVLSQDKKYLYLQLQHNKTDILIVFKADENVHDKQLQIVLKTKLLACYSKSLFVTMIQTPTPLLVATFLTQISNFGRQILQMFQKGEGQKSRCQKPKG